MYPRKRILASIRNEIPLISIVPAVLLGQIGFWLAQGSECTPSHVLPVVLILMTLAPLMPRAFLSVVRRLASLRVLIGFAAGVVSAALFTARPFVPADARTYLLVVGSEVRYPMPGAVRFDAAVYSAGGYEHLGFARCAAKHLPWLHTAELVEGDRIFVRAAWRPLSRSGVFSSDSAARRRGYGADCRVRYATQPIRAVYSLGLLRAAIVRRTREIIGDSERVGLLLALTLGVHDVVSDQLERRFREGGLSHLLVVSGFQVGLVASLVFGLLRRLLLLLPIETRGFHLCWMLSFVVAVGFALIVGIQNSVLRAAVAFIYLGLAQLWERGGGIWRGMVAALLIVSLLWPGAYLEPGVQLTFAALVGIATSQSDRAGIVWSGLALSWSVLLCTGWCALLWFGQLAPGALILNLTVAPILGSVVCMLGLAGLLLIWVWPWLGYCILSAALLIMDLGVAIVDLSASSVGRAYEFSGPIGWVVAVSISTLLLVRHIHRYVRTRCVEFGLTAMVRDYEDQLWQRNKPQRAYASAALLGD